MSALGIYKIRTTGNNAFRRRGSENKVIFRALQEGILEARYIFWMNQLQDYILLMKLLHVLDRLVNIGNTVILIEHNLDVIAASDWIVDLGPEGGDNGGNIVVTGTPEQISNHISVYTGKYLKSKLVVSQTIRKNKSGVRT